MSIPSTSAIADVLALWDEDGWLTPPLSPIVPSRQALLARVLTVRVEVASSGQGMTPIYDVLSNDLDALVLVIAGAQGVPGAVWGEILTTAALQQRASGVLVDGCVRDRPDMQRLGLPVYARGEHVGGPSNSAHIVEVGCPVTVAGTAISADDYIVFDACGCVRIPALRRDQVLDGARRYSAAEELVSLALAAGEPLSTAYRHKKIVVDELRG